VKKEEAPTASASVWFWIVVALVFASGVFALWNLRLLLPTPYDDLAKSLGEALIIASVLAATVDLYAKTIMLREVTRDVFHYITGHPLPKQLQDQIRKLVSTDLIRRDMRIRYGFAWYDLGIEGTEHDFVLLTIETEWKLENLSSSEILHQERLELEAHDAPRVINMRCASSESDSCYDQRPQGGANLAKPEPSNQRMLVATGKRIKIRPNLGNPAISYVLACKYECMLPSDHSDVFSFLGPTIGATVEVSAPDDLEVSISDYRAKEVVPRRWEFNQAFSRSECFRIRWNRKAAGA
jgi:hypothetical protein